MQDSAAVESYLQWVLATVTRWGPLVTFAAMTLECIPFVGFAVPGLTVLVAAGFLAATQEVAQGLLLFTAAFIGVIIGDNLGYAAGRGSHRLPPVRRLVDRNARLAGEIERQPLLLLLFYQFPPYSRMFAPLLMGALDFPLRRWAGVVTGGTLVFVIAFFGLGYLAGRAGQAMLGVQSAASTVSALFVVALLVWVGGLAWKLYRTGRQRKEAPS